MAAAAVVLIAPWLGYAGVLARSGFQAFLFDFRGFGDSAQARAPAATWRLQEDLAGAIAEARRQGARHVFLVGASMGAVVVVVAAPTIRPPVDGVETSAATIATARNEFITTTVMSDIDRSFG